MKSKLTYLNKKCTLDYPCNEQQDYYDKNQTYVIPDDHYCPYCKADLLALHNDLEDRVADLLDEAEELLKTANTEPYLH